MKAGEIWLAQLDPTVGNEIQKRLYLPRMAKEILDEQIARKLV